MRTRSSTLSHHRGISRDPFERRDAAGAEWPARLRPDGCEGFQNSYFPGVHAIPLGPSGTERRPLCATSPPSGSFGGTSTYDYIVIFTQFTHLIAVWRTPDTFRCEIPGPTPERGSGDTHWISLRAGIRQRQHFLQIYVICASSLAA